MAEALLHYDISSLPIRWLFVLSFLNLMDLSDSLTNKICLNGRLVASKVKFRLFDHTFLGILATV